MMEVQPEEYCSNQPRREVVLPAQLRKAWSSLCCA